MTNPHKDEPQYANSVTSRLGSATDYTPELVRLGHECLERIYRSGYSYKKAGVMLMDIERKETRHLGFFDPSPLEAGRRAELMGTLDHINAKWGRGTLQYAAAGLGRPWRMRQLRKSPRFTTCWEEIPVVR